MGKIKLFLIIALLSIASIANAQAYNWIGAYSYTVKSGSFVQGDEVLTITKSTRAGYDYEWTIEAVGYQMYYVIKGYAINKDTYFDFYLQKVTEGAYFPEERIDKRRVLFKLMYSKGQVLTRWMQPQAQKAFHPYFKPE